MSLPWTRRHFRLGSGLILWVYVATHLSNHALGVVSLSAAELGLQAAVVVWHSVMGTGFLYAAFTVHLSLALLGLYQRHTLRLPPMELLRIAFGLSIPLLLVGHAVSTRMAWELYGLAPKYERVVWGLIYSGTEGRQIALLAPGWLHGCMGLNVALRHHPVYQRWRWVFWVAVTVLPLLAATGFLAMTAELAAMNAVIPAPSAVQSQVLSSWRERLLGLYLALVAAVLAARWLRDHRLRSVAGPPS